MHSLVSLLTCTSRKGNLLNGELYVWVLSTEVFVKTLQLILSVRPDDVCIIHVYSVARDEGAVGLSAGRSPPGAACTG